MTDATTKLETVEACKSLSDEQVAEQIRLRHHWIDKVLIGWLYKSVMADEIDKLHEMLNGRPKCAVNNT